MTERLALRAVQLGAIAVVLAAATLHTFELDRFFVPKELVLHLTAVVAGLLLFRSLRVENTLLAFLGLGVVSALFATNPWLAMRAMAITASGLVLYAAGRVLGMRVINALAIAVVAVAVTSLLQTYGIETTLFSENRAPGGTLGNRNFVAHAAAFGLPVLLLATLRAQRWYFAGAIGVAITVASLVLTRSRAAWLAFGAVVVVFVLGMLMRGDARTWRRLAGIVLIAGGGVAAALLIPNTLRWRSDNPYLETLERVTEYDEGSGRGRLIQYERSLVMAARHPLLGVGPGNWAVEYPEHRARRDPSMSDTDGGMTTNPWPSSDWIAYVSERGLAAAVVLAIALFGMALRAFRQLRAAADAEGGLAATALLGTLAGAGVAGAFDAVLLLALPTFLVWTALGALSVSSRAERGIPSHDEPAPRASGSLAMLGMTLCIAIAALGAYRSTTQLVAMSLYERGSVRGAAEVDPGNYRIRLRAARMGGRERCEHARAAHALFPNADAAAAAARGCGR